MANYKNIDLDDQLVGMIRHMQIIDDCRAELNDLQTVWDNLTLLGHLSGTGNNMNATRQSFQKLTSSLLNQLVSETLRKTIGEMQSKAQVAIDSLVRNLFERTADIGFLATDADIREVLLKANTLKGQYSKEAELKEPLARIAGRFAEYVAKYSVYSDIVLFDTEGEIVLRLNEKVNVKNTEHPFKPGEIFPVASVISGLNPGDERAGVYIFDGQYYAMGAHASSGYREYKDKTDHYRNEVIAVVGKTLCVVAEQSDDIHAPACPVIRSERSENGNTLEIATFRLGDEWFGIRGSQVIEAVDPTNITPAPGAGSICVGYLVFDKAPIPVFDIRTIICTSKNQIKPGLLKNQQVMIIEKNAATRFGIMTDSLGEIPEINETRLCELPLFIANGALLADAAVAPDNAESESLLLVLSSDRLAQQLATNFSERPSLKVLGYDAEVN